MSTGTVRVHNFPRLCADQGFSPFFAHARVTIKDIISRHFVYAGAIIQLYKQYISFQFSLDQIILGAEPKIVDAWNWSLKIALQLHSGGFALQLHSGGFALQLHSGGFDLLEPAKNQDSIQNWQVLVLSMINKALESVCNSVVLPPNSLSFCCVCFYQSALYYRLCVFVLCGLRVCYKTLNKITKKYICFCKSFKIRGA